MSGSRQQKQEIMERIKHGDVDAIYDMGDAYDRRGGFNRRAIFKENQRMAFKWYELAAEQGHREAQYRFAVMCSIKRDYKQAFKWFKLAAEQGCPTSIYNVGLMYKRGHGVDRDFEQAIKWLTLTKKQGADMAGLAGEALEEIQGQIQELTFRAKKGKNPADQYELGRMYWRGDGVAQDYKQAFKWFKCAAEQGHSLAQIRLGMMYRDGQGVDRDKKQAIKWLTLSAEQGDSGAQLRLGRMYRVDRDYEQSIKWLTLAANQGHSLAGKLLEEIQEQI